MSQYIQYQGTLIPNGDFPTHFAKYSKGGLAICSSFSKVLEIKKAFREQPMIALNLFDFTIYRLVNNPNTEFTVSTDWQKFSFATGDTVYVPRGFYTPATHSPAIQDADYALMDLFIIKSSGTILQAGLLGSVSTPVEAGDYLAHNGTSFVHIPIAQSAVLPAHTHSSSEITDLPDFNTFLTTVNLVESIDPNGLENATLIASVASIIEFCATKDELSALETTINGLSSSFDNFYDKEEIDQMFLDIESSNWYYSTTLAGLPAATEGSFGIVSIGNDKGIYKRLLSGMTLVWTRIIDFSETQNNYTDADKLKVDAITLVGDGTQVLANDGTYKPYIVPNTVIVASTKTKITYDAKGLVTAGEDATTADVADSLNKRYVTDAYLTVLSNTSGTNTGDNAVNSLYSGLATTKQDTLVSGTNIKTLNGTSLLGAGNISISGSTNLSIVNNTATTLDIASDTGTDATIPQATTSLAGLLNAADKTKLDGLNAANYVLKTGNNLGADANSFSDITDATLGAGNIKYFSHTTGATNYPTTAGAVWTFTGGTAGRTFSIDKTGTSDGALSYRDYSTSTTANAWKVFAFQDWVTSNYLPLTNPVISGSSTLTVSKNSPDMIFTVLDMSANRVVGQIIQNNGSGRYRTTLQINQNLQTQYSSDGSAWDVAYEIINTTGVTSFKKPIELEGAPAASSFDTVITAKQGGTYQPSIKVWRGSSSVRSGWGIYGNLSGVETLGLSVKETGIVDIPVSATINTATFTGTTIAPTPTLGSDDTQVATTAFVSANILPKLLTGLNISGSTITAADTILLAFGKLQNQINNVLGGAIYQSTWNASTNTPSLANGVGTKGHYYVVSVGATRNLGAGNIEFAVGDWAIYNGTIWEKVDNTDAVTSVNGQIGPVNLTTANISEVTNLYFTEGRVRTTVLTGFTSGVGTVSASDSVLSAIQKLDANIATKVGLSGDESIGGNKTFTNNVILANASADTHGLNRITADGRYLPLAYNDYYPILRPYNGASSNVTTTGWKRIAERSTGTTGRGFSIVTIFSTSSPTNSSVQIYWGNNNNSGIGELRIVGGHGVISGLNSDGTTIVFRNVLDGTVSALEVNVNDVTSARSYYCQISDNLGRKEEPTTLVNWIDSPGGSVITNDGLSSNVEIPYNAFSVRKFRVNLTGGVSTPYNITANQFTSTVTTGTAPMVVASTTLVTNLNADLLDGLNSTDFLAITGGTLTGQLISTRANSTTTGGGQIYLNGATGNRIDFNSNGTAVPGFTTRSLGTKLVLSPTLSGSAVDYAIGVAPATMWYSVANSSASFAWYAGTTSIASLSGTGALTIGNIQLATQTISAVGGASDITLILSAKGTANIDVTSTIQTSGRIQPAVDNNMDIALSNQRYRTLYLGTSLVINSSSNQIVLGSGTYNITLSAAATASNKILTFPDETGTIATREWVNSNIPTYPTLIAGSTIDFTAPKVFGYNTAALTGNITWSFTSAKIGAVVVIRHNDASTPTFPASAVVIGGSYVTGVDNFIYLNPIVISGGSEVVHVTISQVV